MDLKGTIVFTTVGHGFDVFSVKIPSNFHIQVHCEQRLTDGISINFKGQFVDEEETLVHVSERTGSSRIFMTRRGTNKPEQCPSPSENLVHDCPIISNGRLYFNSAYEPADKPFKSGFALYSTGLDNGQIVEWTSNGSVDYSLAISRFGKLIAVASYGSRLTFTTSTDIVVFKESDPTKCTVAGPLGPATPPFTSIAK